LSNVLSENWYYATVSIEDDNNRLGTGYLVADTEPTAPDRFGICRPTWEKPRHRAYVVTARHVLGDNPSVIGTTLSYTLSFNGTRDLNYVRQRLTFEVINEPRNWAVHPDPRIDVAVVDVTTLLESLLNQCQVRFCPLTEIGNAVSLTLSECDAGDEVYVLGYPLTLRQGRTNLPVVRSGIAATSPRRRLLDADGNDLRGFLVDGAILPGSSGSPVVAHSQRYYPGDLALNPARPLALGVVAQEWGRGDSERYFRSVGPAASEASSGYANLGFAHDASTIIETIVQLGRSAISDFIEPEYDRHWHQNLGIARSTIDASQLADNANAGRIMLRVWRDHLRATGSHVEANELDAEDIMGPVVL
jgi:hypothetical protein